MANVKIYKFLLHISALALALSEITKINCLYLQKVVQGHGVKLSPLHHSMANVKIYKISTHVLVSSYRLRCIYLFNFFTSKKVIAECNFCKYTFRWQNLQNFDLYIFDFRPCMTYANDFNRQTHTDIKTNTETDKLIAICEILQICLKTNKKTIKSACQTLPNNH